MTRSEIGAYLRTFSRSVASGAFNAFLNTFFPASCILCQATISDWASGAICSKCESALEPVGPPICSRCGLAGPGIRGLCGTCRAGRTGYDFGRAALVFTREVRQIIHELKYKDRVSLARPLGCALERTFRTEAFGAELAVPVPLHPRRERQRGYNQAELLARRLGIRVDSRLLRRARPTESQTGLSRYQRRINMRGAFECRGRITGAVLLVDDLLTTGATINAAARVLRRSGATKVEVLTISRVPYPDDQDWTTGRVSLDSIVQ